MPIISKPYRKTFQARSDLTVEGLNCKVCIVGVCRLAVMMIPKYDMGYDFIFLREILDFKVLVFRCQRGCWKKKAGLIAKETSLEPKKVYKLQHKRFHSWERLPAAIMQFWL